MAASPDAVFSPCIPQGKRLGDVAVKGWGAHQRLYCGVSLFCSCLQLRCCPSSGCLGPPRRGVRLPGQCKGAAAYTAVHASHRCRVTMPGLLSSASGRCCWEAPAGHRKGSVWTTGQLQEGCFLPRSAHSLFLPCPARSCTSPALTRSDLAGTGSGTRKQPLQLLLLPAPPEKSCPSCGGEPASPVLGCPRQSPGDALGASGPACTRVTADTAGTTCPRSRLPPRRLGSQHTLLLSWPEDFLAAGVKFPTGTCSPTGGGGSQGLARVSHPVLFARAFGLHLRSPVGPPSAKPM